jgi:hypothetical protein
MKLTVAAPRQPGTQLPIWDWVGNVQFTSMAQTRTATGEFCEEATRQLLGGERLSTQGTVDICPDIKLDEQRYLEVKSVATKRCALLYEHILDRTVRFVRRNKVTIWYCFWVHGVAAAQIPSLFDLRRAMASSMERLIIVPFPIVHEVVKRLPPRKMNYRAREHNGDSIPMLGWSIPVAQLKAWSQGQPRMAFDTTVYGYTMGGYPIYGAVDAHPSPRHLPGIPAALERDCHDRALVPAADSDH